MKPFRSEIAGLGHEVVPIAFAEDALERLCGADDVDLVILDVMLGVRSSAASQIFSPQATRDGSQTGLVLLRELMGCNPECFPTRCMLITHSTLPAVLKATRQVSSDHKVPWYPKSQFSTPYSFSRTVSKLLDSRP
jgi:hypothetical protein